MYAFPCLGPAPLQVGVRLVPAAPRPGLLGFKQRVTISGTARPYTVAFKYLYGTDTAASVVYSVVITAADPLQLINENIGLRLSINDVNVTVGVAWAAREMDDAIETALGGAFKSVETNFGVYKSVAPDGLSATLLLAAASNTTGITVTAAKIVWPLYPFTPAPCTWANPLMAVTLPDPPNPTGGMT